MFDCGGQLNQEAWMIPEYTAGISNHSKGRLFVKKVTLGNLLCAKCTLEDSLCRKVNALPDESKKTKQMFFK